MSSRPTDDENARKELEDGHWRIALDMAKKVLGPYRNTLEWSVIRPSESRAHIHLWCKGVPITEATGIEEYKKIAVFDWPSERAASDWINHQGGIAVTLSSPKEVTSSLESQILDCWSTGGNNLEKLDVLANYHERLEREQVMEKRNYEFEVMMEMMDDCEYFC